MMLTTVKVRSAQIRELLMKLDCFACAHETALFWSFGILYKFALDAVYLWATSPQYAYAGLVCTPNFFKYCVSTVLYLVIFTALPRRERDTVSFLLQLQFVFTVAPMLCYYAMANGSTRYMGMVVICILLQIWLVDGTHDRPGKQIHITGIKPYVTVAMGVLVIFTALVPVFYNGFEGIKAFDFAYIYTMRSRATYPLGFPYLLSWVTNVILPFGVLQFLDGRQYKKVGICIALQLLFYMETGHKKVFLILFPLIAIHMLAKSGHLIKLMYAGLMALCVLTVIGYQLDALGRVSRLGMTVNAIFAIRALFVPANIKFDYYNCFQVLPKVHFSDGMIGRLLSLSYPYKASVGQVVYTYAGGTFLESNSNTGYLGDSYAQLGFLGMLLMSALLGLILRALRAYDSRRNFALLTALFAVYFITLNDSALFTTLFTGGMLVAFVLVFIYFGKQTEDSTDGIQRL